LCALGVFIGIATFLGVTYVMLAKSDLIDGVLKEGGRRVVTTLMGAYRDGNRHSVLY